MNRVRNQVVILAGMVAMSWATMAGAQAQAPLNRYPTPALSPWFNLYQKQGGPVDNYNMFVRPQQQLRGTLQMQQFELQRQATNTNSQGEQISQIEENHQAVAPTGGAAGFMNHLSYFGIQTGQGNVGSMRPQGQLRPGANNTWTLPAANTMNTMSRSSGSVSP